MIATERRTLRDGMLWLRLPIRATVAYLLLLTGGALLSYGAGLALGWWATYIGAGLVLLVSGGALLYAATMPGGGGPQR